MKETLHIYTRVSTDRQAEMGGSLESQKRLGIEKSIQLGFENVIHEEKGKSANEEDLKNRPILENLLALCDEKIVKYIYVTEMDRLTRNVAVNVYIKKILKDNDVILYTAKGQFDFNNDDDEFMSDLYALFSKRENVNRAAKSKRGKKDSARKGKHHGGATAFGYRSNEKKELVIDEDESKIYLQIVSDILQGIGANTIAKKLNDNNVKTKMYKYTRSGYYAKTITNGKRKFVSKEEMRWNPSTILRILKNPLYCGDRRYKGEIVNAPSIIDKPTWQNIQKKFSDNYEKSFRNRKHNFYLLSNILMCSICDRPMYGRFNKESDISRYVCSSKQSPHYSPCVTKNIDLPSLNNLVWNVLVDVLTNSERAQKELKRIFTEMKTEKAPLEKRNQSLKKSMAKLENEKENIITIYSKGMIKESDLEKQLERIANEKESITTEISTNESKLSMILDQDNTLHFIKNYYKTLDLLTKKNNEEKRSIILKFIKRVSVKYIEEEEDFSVVIELKYPIYDKNMTENQYYLSQDINNDAEDTQNENIDKNIKKLKTKLKRKLYIASMSSLPVEHNIYIKPDFHLILKIHFLTTDVTYKVIDTQIAFEY